MFTSKDELSMNYKEELLDELVYYNHCYPDELMTTSQCVNLLINSLNPFHREFYHPGHFVASAWILNKEKSQVLLTYHKKLNRWLQLGGHADGNSNIKGVALKEGYEESGLRELQFLTPHIFDLSIHDFPQSKECPTHKHFDIRFLLHSSISNDYVISDESHDLKWVALEDVYRFNDNPELLRLVEKTRQFI